MSRDSYAWAPETVRHLFRLARFGAHCPHGVARFLVGPIVWVSVCPFDCTWPTSPGSGAVFALGHQREVPPAALGLRMNENMTGQRLLRMIGTPVLRDTWRDGGDVATLADVLSLAIGLGVDTWARTEGRCRGAAGRPISNGDRALVGFVFGVPACVIAPPAQDHHLAPRRAA